MVTAHNFAPGNAGIIFWSDIFLPLFGLMLLWLDRWRRTGSRTSSESERKAPLIPSVRSPDSNLLPDGS
jgi:hypothetical protein